MTDHERELAEAREAALELTYRARGRRLGPNDEPIIDALIDAAKAAGRAEAEAEIARLREMHDRDTNQMVKLVARIERLRSESPA